MRLRPGALAFVALFLAVVSGGCQFSGQSAIYMTIDSGGYQHRDLFFTDTIAIYCNVLFSTAKQDSTVDFTIYETAGPSIGSGMTAPPLHNVFAGAEIVPGPGVEQVVNFQIPPQGLMVTTNCLGYCTQNGVGCPAGYFQQAPDSAGPGATCCYDPTGQPASCAGAVPYPVGSFKCEVQIDGVLQPEQPEFLIEYPPPVTVNGVTEVCPVAPPVTGIICAGWVPQGAKCDGFNEGEICTCQGAGWNCVKP